MSQDANRKQRTEQELVYDFGNSAVLLTHAAINGGETVQGVFSGTWNTVRTGLTSFGVKEVNARLILPSLELWVPGKKKPARTKPGSIYLTKNAFDVPEHLAEMFPKPNTGVFHPRQRFYSVVFGMHVVFPFAYAEGNYLNLEPTSLLLRTTGYTARDGSLIASGVGTILRGFLNGLMFACGHGSSKPAPPPKCGAVEPNSTFMCDLKPDHEGDHVNNFSGHIWTR